MAVCCRRKGKVCQGEDGAALDYSRRIEVPVLDDEAGP